MLLMLLAAAPAPLPMQWAEFSRSGALSRVIETVDIATGNMKGTTTFRYKLRFTKNAPGKDLEIKWADSATCAAVISVISSMREIAMPSPAPYGIPGQKMSITVDGIGYYLTAPSSFNMGQVTLTSNVGSPLASWIDASFKKLEPCWAMAAS